MYICSRFRVNLIDAMSLRITRMLTSRFGKITVTATGLQKKGGVERGRGVGDNLA